MDTASSAPLKPALSELLQVLKEGGKRGVEIEGAADMGGLQSWSWATAVNKSLGLRR